MLKISGVGITEEDRRLIDEACDNMGFKPEKGRKKGKPLLYASLGAGGLGSIILGKYLYDKHKKSRVKTASSNDIRSYSADAAEVNGGRNKVSIYDRMLAEDAGYTADQAQAMQSYNPRMLTAIRNGKPISSAPMYYVDSESVPRLDSSATKGALTGFVAGTALGYPIIAAGNTHPERQGKYLLAAAGTGALVGGISNYLRNKAKRQEVALYNNLVDKARNGGR